MRRITLVEDAPRGEVETFVRILRTAGAANDSQDDLVTLLWQANLSHVQIEAVPLEQTIYLSSHDGGGSGGGADPRRPGLRLHAQRLRDPRRPGPGGRRRRASTATRSTTGPCRRDRSRSPGRSPGSQPGAEAARLAFLAAWEEESSAGWTEQAMGLLRGLRELDDSEDMRRVLARAATTWVTAALQGAAWDEGTRALELLNQVDPERRLGGGELAAALGGLDVQEIVDRFADGDPADLSRFAAFVVGLGPPAVGLCVDVMALADKARARAATVTALCYLCAEDPEALAPWLLDSRWYVVRNVVFVLGHIGGPAVAPLLQTVSRHPEPHVRRQLVQALASLPAAVRTPMLLDQLDTRDPQLLAGALGILTREPDPRTVRAILACIAAPDFESRDENNQRALFGALGEIADDGAVPALEALLHRAAGSPAATCSGWPRRARCAASARRTPWPRSRRRCARAARPCAPRRSKRSARGAAHERGSRLRAPRRRPPARLRPGPHRCGCWRSCASAAPTRSRIRPSGSSSAPSSRRCSPSSPRRTRWPWSLSTAIST